MKRILQVIFCASIAQLVVSPLFPVRKRLMNKHVLPATEIACATLKGVLTKAGMLYHDQNEARRAKICFGLASVVGCAHGATMLANAQSRMDGGNNLAAGSLIVDSVVTFLMHLLGNNNDGLGFGHKFSATDHGMVNVLALSEIVATVLASYSPDVAVMHSIEFKTAMNNLVAAFDACEKAIVSGTMHDPGIWQNLQLTVLAVAALSNFGSGFYHGLVSEKPAPRVRFRSRDSVRIIPARKKPKTAKNPAKAVVEDEAGDADDAGDEVDGGAEERPVEDGVARSLRVIHYDDAVLENLDEADRCAICLGRFAAGQDRFALACGHGDCLGCARLYYNRFPADNPAVEGYEYRLYRCQHPGCGEMTALDVPDAQILAEPAE